MAEILANPRYTGRQVWNRQRLDHNETDPRDRRTSRGAVRRWNPKAQWVVSTRIVHPPLVSEADFVNAQAISALQQPDDGQQRRYLLTGLVRCQACGRRAEAHLVHGRPGYRCRHGRTSASPPMTGRPSPLYVREDRLLAAAATQIEYDDVDGWPEPAAVAAKIRQQHLLIACDGQAVSVIDPTHAGVGPATTTPTQAALT